MGSQTKTAVRAKLIITAFFIFLVITASGCSTAGSSDFLLKGRGQPLKKVELREARHYIGNLIWPVRRARYTSRFGWRGSSFHEGIDLAASSGTPIYAAHAGTVVYSGNGIRGYGNLIAIRGRRLLTVYGHNRRNYVRAGDRVRQGERIADVGATGRANGPHLHFETRVGNTSEGYAAVNPLIFYP